MKKYTFALALVALLPIVSAGAYEYTQSQGEYNSAHRPVAKTNSYKKASTTRRTGGYTNVVTNNFYYGQPAQYYTQKSGNAGNRDSGYRGKGYAGGYYGAGSNENIEKQGNRTIKSYSSQERKYFLAHPFFQPLKGRVGSVTDVSYARNNFDFDLLNGRVFNLDAASGSYASVTPVGTIGSEGLGKKAETSQFAVKEDLSFGLTDRLALVLMAQYDNTKTTFNFGDISDTKSKSGLNLFGGGLQVRFVDSDNWIVMGEAFFQHQKDTANTFMSAVKAGYKVGSTTFYGVGRVAYTNLINGDKYGVYVDDTTGDWLMLSYNTNIKDVFQAEGGMGAFAVLGKYFTLNGELMYGYYDWHDQLNVKGALGWQPADHFALNIYASTVLYDSARDKVRKYMSYDVNPEDFPKVDGNPVFTDSKLLYTEGDYKIKNYNEWKIGVQAILYF